MLDGGQRIEDALQHAVGRCPRMKQLNTDNFMEILCLAQLCGSATRPELSRDRKAADARVRKLDHGEVKLSLYFRNRSSRNIHPAVRPTRQHHWPSLSTFSRGFARRKTADSDSEKPVRISCTARFRDANQIVEKRQSTGC